MVNSHRKFVILDYGAKYIFTHHLPIIHAICIILSQNGFTADIYLSKYAIRSDYNLIPGNKKYKLIGSVYGPTYKENIVISLFLKVCEIVLRNQSQETKLKKLLKLCFSFKMKRILLNDCKKSKKNIIVICPTADPISIQLARSLLSTDKSKNFFFKFRIVGSENRGFLASENELELLSQLVNDFSGQIQLGVETVGYRNVLIEKNIHTKNIFWSPWPPIIKNDLKKNKNGNLMVLGFLGNAKERKGFSHIPNILRDYEKINPFFSAIIQPAQFPWKGYFDILQELKPFFHKIIFTDKNLKLQQLLEFVANTDVLILPYDSISYSINASGLLYHASDYNIPVITLKGVGFESEVSDYKLGFVVNSPSDIVHQIRSLNRTIFNFGAYRDARLKATQKFIFES